MTVYLVTNEERSEPCSILGCVSDKQTAIDFADSQAQQNRNSPYYVYELRVGWFADIEPCYSVEIDRDESHGWTG